MKIQTPALTALDAAAKVYRKAYNKGYKLSEMGDDVMAQKILDAANAKYDEAKAEYAVATA